MIIITITVIKLETGSNCNPSVTLKCSSWSQGLTRIEKDEELKAHVLVVVQFELTGFLDQLKQTYPNIAQPQLVQGVEAQPRPIWLKNDEQPM